MKDERERIASLVMQLAGRTGRKDYIDYYLR
jgi:hypothetical protein